jgi:hypothetical protein
MMHLGKRSMWLGVAALALAILGIITVVAVPSVAGPKSPDCSGDQGLSTPNLGI